MGGGILAVTWNSWRRGEHRITYRGRTMYRIDRKNYPVAFKLVLVLYVCGGIALCAFGVLGLFGMAPSLRLR